MKVEERAQPDLSIMLEIDEPSQIGAARRAAVALGHSHALSSASIGRLAIVVTEASTNIIRHAVRGTIVLRGMLMNGSPAIELMALDQGPGIPDVDRAMRDGYSTMGTSGQGLGAMKRLSQLFEITSTRGKGTVVIARVGDEMPIVTSASPIDVGLGVLCLPMPGEVECGDAWRIVVGRDRIAVMLVDGLGHGPGAASAAALATSTFSRVAAGPPDIALGAFDQAMRGSRGAALSVAVIDTRAGTLHFSGVGNVDGRVLSEGPAVHCSPQNGIVGHTMPKVRTTVTAWPRGARLVLHSDGVSARWRDESYPGLYRLHPSLIAGILYRDLGRTRDDATVIVISAAGVAAAGS